MIDRLHISSIGHNKESALQMVFKRIADDPVLRVNYRMNLAAPRRTPNLSAYYHYN